MSDPTPINDDLISAYLDDEVTAHERAVIEADADSMARLAELRLVRDAVAAPVAPLDDADRDRLLGAALAASATSPTVSSMTVARSQRARIWRPLAAVAAAVTVIGLAVPALRNINLGSDAGDTAASTADSAADEPAAEPADEAAAEMMAPSVDAATAGGDDAATAQMPLAADGAVAEADMSADEPAEESVEQAAGAIAFDPLPSELGDFESVDLAVDRVFADYEVWLENPGAVNLRNLGPDPLDGTPCLDELDQDVLLDGQMSDTATATIEGVDHVIRLLEEGLVQLTPIDACRPVTTRNHIEG